MHLYILIRLFNKNILRSLHNKNLSKHLKQRSTPVILKVGTSNTHQVTTSNH